MQGAPGRPVQIEVERLGGDLCRLSLEGVLWPGWAGNLASGLAAQRMSILRGSALGGRAGLWTATFDVLRLPDAPDPASLDLLALARHDAREGFSTPLRIGRFALHPALEHDGSLQLVVSAQDRIGFLAALLRRLAYFSLFPVEMRLDTRGDRVTDELWLRAGGDRPPSTTTREALAHALGALLEE
jgi:hypothetical protein